jgi:hypothetical protein
LEYRYLASGLGIGMDELVCFNNNASIQVLFFFHANASEKKGPGVTEDVDCEILKPILEFQFQT